MVHAVFIDNRNKRERLYLNSIEEYAKEVERRHETLVFSSVDTVSDEKIKLGKYMKARRQECAS